MKQRREVRERIAQWKADEAAAARSVDARTISFTEFAYLTGTSNAQIHKDIDAGKLRTKTIGKRRRIALTRDALNRVKAGLERLMREVEGDIGG